MANSGTVTAGSAALASQYNNLRDDVLNVSTGHTHTGASENGAKVAATGVSSGTAALNAVLTADGSGGASFLALAAAGADVQEFTSSGSWVKPAGKSAVYVFAVGAGGGGGSGRRGFSPSTAFGGVGGAGGAVASRWFTASSLGGTITVTIGSGGAGGTAISAGSTAENGANGSSGGNTTFGTVIVAPGGPFGIGGTDTTITGLTLQGVAEYGLRPNISAGTAGTPNTSDLPGTALASGANRFTTEGAQPGQTSIQPLRTFTRPGGGAGGGGFSDSATSIYGAGAGARGFGNEGTVPSGGSYGGSAVAGGAGSAGSVNGAIGIGGGGGGPALNAAGGAGGAGYVGGGGGGGGGVYRTSGSHATGAGGAGGGGYMLVISV